MALLLFRSRALVAPHSMAEGMIWLQSRHNNIQNDVTGHLHREEGWFVHAVEGGVAELDRLVLRLRGDSRHSEMKALIRNDGDAPRRFAQWSMGFSDPSCGVVFGPSIGSASGDDLLVFLQDVAAHEPAA